MNWRNRAKHFNDLKWVNHQLYLEAFVRAGKFSKSDIVLDVGTGTGIIARSIAPLVKVVVGLDKSEDMLRVSRQLLWPVNISFVKMNILQQTFGAEVFDKITARHVFHHIVRGTQRAMNECYRVLKKRGLMVLSEGVPPSPEVKEDYIKIFRLKEVRLTFMSDYLVALMERAGFQNIHTETIWLRRMSVRNWLTNSGLPQVTQDRIFHLHVNGREVFKRAYNMVEADNDCFIDMKMAILTGEKYDK